MRNISIVVMIVGLAVLLYGLQRSQEEEPVAVDPHAGHNHPPGEHPENSPAPTQSSATESRSVRASQFFDLSHPGYQIYTGEGCATCHGSDLLGTRMAPPLVDVRKHFDLASLGEYLSDPDAYILDDPRLQGLDSQYQMQVMPAYDLTDEELAALGGLILESK